MSKPRVIRSVEAADGVRCVDIFVRDDGTFGFEEYRRDPEDPRGWFAVGGFFGERYDAAEQALAAARHHIVWLDDVVS